MNYESGIRNRGWKYFNSLIHYSLFIIPLVIISLVLLSAFTDRTYAADEDVGPRAIQEKLQGAAEEGAGLESKDAPALAGRIVRAALVLVGLAFLVLTLYGGFLLLTAGGNEEQVENSKKIITRAVIGITIVLFAGAITQFITGYIARPVEEAREEGEEQVDTSLFGGCPDGYRYLINFSSGYDIWNYDAQCIRE